MDWSAYFPSTELDSKKITIVDVGCGYGGLLIGLSALFPNTLLLGMEIRQKVTDYVSQRIDALRSISGQYGNIGVIRTNAMKLLPHFFEKGQLEKMFFLFPDPHFKRKKHKARIITYSLLSEYAYFLKMGGELYIATDVQDLYSWMFSCLSSHPLFELVPSSTYTTDPIISHVLNSTEEGIKVSRKSGDKFAAIFRRIPHAIETNIRPQQCVATTT